MALLHPLMILLLTQALPEVVSRSPALSSNVASVPGATIAHSNMCKLTNPEEEHPPKSPK